MTDVENLVLIQEPLRCPACDVSDRLGFLLKLFDEAESEFIVNGPQITHRCNTCGALFGVEK